MLFLEVRAISFVLKSIQASRVVSADTVKAGGKEIVLISLRCIDFHTRSAEATQSPVGVSLLAMRACQLKCMLTVRPLSRAGSLQGNVIRQITQGLAGMPYLRKRIAIALWDVCNRAANNRLDG